MPDAARARDSPGPNIRMLQKTIAGCRVSSRFFRRACTRASDGRSGDGPSGGRRPLKPGTARPGTAPTARTQQANRFFSTIFQYFVHIARFAPSQIAFSRQIFRFLSRKVDLLHDSSNAKSQDGGTGGPRKAKAALRSPLIRSPRRPPREPACGARGVPRRGARGERCQRRPPSDEARPIGRSACRLYAPDAELAGTKVMRW